MTEDIKLPECICLRCNWHWTPRIPHPRICPNPECRSIYWDLPRKEKGNGDKEVSNDSRE
jgi:hypothetical protein